MKLLLVRPLVSFRLCITVYSLMLFVTSTMQLALKHGIETKGVKRVVVFVGSPIQDNQRALKKVGKHLRRNNVCDTVCAYGDSVRLFKS